MCTYRHFVSKKAVILCYCCKCALNITEKNDKSVLFSLFFSFIISFSGLREICFLVFVPLVVFDFIGSKLR